MAGKGQPQGFVGNPTGKNQYVNAAGQGERNAQITLRLPTELKTQIQMAASLQNQSLTAWLEKAIAQYLDFEIIRDALLIALKEKKKSLARQLKQKNPNPLLISQLQTQIKKLEQIILSA